MSALEQARAYAAGAAARIQQRDCRCERCMQALEEERLQAVLRMLETHRRADRKNIFAPPPRPRKIIVISPRRQA